MADDVAGDLGLARDHRPAAPLEDSGLLARDPRQIGTEELGVVVIHRRDDGQLRHGQDIGGVQRPTQPDLDQGQVGLDLAHGDEGRRRGAFEDSGLARDGLDPVEDGLQRRIADQAAGQPDALIEPHQMRRGIDMDFEACGLGHGAQEGDGGALAVGPRHMDHGRQSPLRVPERRAQGGHPLQRQIDPLGVPLSEALRNGVHVFCRPLHRFAVPLPRWRGRI